IGPDPRNFNQRVSLGRNDLLIRTFPNNLGVNTFRANNRSVTFSDGVIQYFSSQCLVFMQAI
ncbi:hypothetical protein OSL54_23055, partial [Escherichia coli]|nr:hypothetical protein [Escherichia coli]